MWGSSRPGRKDQRSAVAGNCLGAPGAAQLFFVPGDFSVLGVMFHGVVLVRGEAWRRRGQKK